MPSPLDELGIEEGDSTPVRDITAPQKGDQYITSYYELLSAVEQKTVHFADDPAELPEPEYGPLLGVAPSTTGETDQKTVHVYDGTGWEDTFTAIDDLVGEVNDRHEHIVVEFDNGRNLEGSFTRKIKKGERLELGRSDFDEYKTDYEDNNDISRQHFELWYRPDGMKIRDLGSRNGTRFDNEGIEMSDPDLWQTEDGESAFSDWYDMPNGARLEFAYEYSNSYDGYTVEIFYKFGF